MAQDWGRLGDDSYASELTETNPIRDKLLEQEQQQVSVATSAFSAGVAGTYSGERSRYVHGLQSRGREKVLTS
jgi:hypothetical protein